ncbi:hypothetical protein [Phytobacter sp. RSE-02]|uniref:hypothetical protein n=1 Tax=Phytobacter sp. RSE-02 TaxID=3229229 RepID=UPI00339D65BF
MARRLTNSDIKKIIESINSWPSQNKLTWEGLCDHVSKKIGKRPTRQSLYMHKDIVDAYEEKKGTVKMKSKCQVRPANLKVAAERIERLVTKIEEHAKTINNQQEYISKLLVFCSRYNIRESDLKFELELL